MNNNFLSIIYIAGKFGIAIREHIEDLIYTNKYSHISANRTLAKLVADKYLKIVDRGKRKTNGYKLTNDGIKIYKRYFGEDIKNYSSGDKLQHSIYIVNFYSHIINDIKKRYNIEEINLMEEKRLYFHSEKQIDFLIKDKKESIIPDAFFIYKYKNDRAKVCFLEIENSDRRANYIAQKTLNNYEKYYQSGKWKKELWQMKQGKIFPFILIVAYSEFKQKEIIKQFNSKIKLDFLKDNYYFSNYKELKDNGISGEVWRNINGEKVSLF